jgi:hypothetical protein
MVKNIAHKVTPDEARIILEQARLAWDARHSLRMRRMRAREYERGRQWGDLIEDPESGEVMTEEEYIRNNGRVPVVNNQIGTLVRNLLGQYRQSHPDPIVTARVRERARAGEMMTNTLRYVLDQNEVEEIDVSEFNEFLRSGCAAFKVQYKWLPYANRDDVTIDTVHQARLFHNADIKDRRLRDLTLIGEIMDVDLDTLVSTYASSKKEAEKVRGFYPMNEGRDRIAYDLMLGSSNYDNLDFLMPHDTTMARVIEVWRVEHKWQRFAHDPADGSFQVTDASDEELGVINEARLINALQQGIDPEAVPMIDVQERYEPVWMCYHLTPTAEVLWACQTPYLHESHPYEILLYPLTDGECYGLIETIIDQQRYINRMIIMMDFALGNSAKGILMVPEDIIPLGEDGKPDYQMFSDQWAKFNGVVFYQPKPHQKIPEQIMANSRIAGAEQLLQLQMNLIKEISGVTSATQGLTPGAGTPASLYAQQTVNAAVTTKDYFDTFYAFLKRRNKKVVKTVLQYYDEPRYIRIDGAGRDAVDVYDPDQVTGLDFDVALGQGTNTVLYRQMVDEYLMKFLEGNLIDLPMFLEMTSLPFADKLKALLEQKMAEQEQMAAAMGAQLGLGAPPMTGSGSPLEQQPVAGPVERERSRKIQQARRINSQVLQ